MRDFSASLELMRFGYASIPGALFNYAQELDLDMDDIGVLATIFYTYQLKSKILFETGIQVGQILQSCPVLTKQKFSKKILKLSKQNIIEIHESNSRNLAEKIIYFEPLFTKLEELLIRDHPKITPNINKTDLENDELKKEIIQYKKKVDQMQTQTQSQNNSLESLSEDLFAKNNKQYKKVADFIAKKTGNLLSVKMSNELKKWLDEMSFTPEFLLCMLELCFERSIDNPSEITYIAKDLKKFMITSVEGLEIYFKNYVDEEKNTALRKSKFDPNLIEFGNYTGIDMSAEARKRLYYKWRYDWRFSHVMIMKAGELMCQRTKNGGPEYIDSVLSNWLSKEIRTAEEVEKELIAFKNKSKNEKAKNEPKAQSKSQFSEYEIYTGHLNLEELKSKV